MSTWSVPLTACIKITRVGTYITQLKRGVFCNTAGTGDRREGVDLSYGLAAQPLLGAQIPSCSALHVLPIASIDIAAVTSIVAIAD